MLIQDKVALVTGAATGIGEGIARLFAAEGARVFLLDRDAAQNEAAAASIRAGLGLARAHTVDVCDPKAIAVAVDSAQREFGRIDILINNAGIFPRRRFVEMSEADWDHMHNVNVKSMFHTIQAVVPHMLSQRSGKIVNISSVTFHLGMPNMSHYISSKGGVIGLTRALAREFGPEGVYVNCITPGAIHTESEKHFVTPDDIRKFLESQCIQRRITPLDIARTALFLSSELSDGLTGQTLNVDGGWVMH
jgi:3-oxoacyl-[acyl-carrier protein] reductase